MPSLAGNHQYLGFIPSLVGVGGGVCAAVIT